MMLQYGNLSSMLSLELRLFLNIDLKSADFGVLKACKHPWRVLMEGRNDHYELLAITLE